MKIKELLQVLIETQKQINKSIKELKETKDFELLELIETISTNYPRMDKYGILDTAKMFSNHYRVEKIQL